MGSSGSVYDNFDQGVWCEQHRPFVNVGDVQATYLYVRWRHPLFGVAKPAEKLPIWNGAEPIEVIAKMADAVTILCLETVGRELTNNEAKVSAQIPDMQTTAVANLAYVALHHADEQVKTVANAHLQAWRHQTPKSQITQNK